MWIPKWSPVDGEVATRELQAGQWAVLETCGLVQIQHILHDEEFVLIQWTAHGSPLPRKPGQGQAGSWSAYYSDVPRVHVYTPGEEGEDHGHG